MSLIRNIRIYANRCPYCGTRMRLYSWKTAPFELPTLTTARVCTRKHYMRTEHVPTGRVTEYDEKGNQLPLLATVSDFPDPLEEEKPLHNNLNVPLRKPPIPAKPAAPAAAPAAAAPAAPASPAPAAPPAAPTTAGSPNGDSAPKPAAEQPTTSQS